jgi:hypothetical protein
LRLQSRVEHVTAQPFDPFAFVSRTRTIENGLIHVETDDVAHACSEELGAENAVAAANIENTRGVRWERGQDQAMVMRVRVPERGHRVLRTVAVLLESVTLDDPSSRCRHD